MLYSTLYRSKNEKHQENQIDWSLALLPTVLLYLSIE